MFKARDMAVFRRAPALVSIEDFCGKSGILRRLLLSIGALGLGVSDRVLTLRYEQR